MDQICRALAAAVALAQYGNGDYAHKDSANFVLSDKKGYDASLTNIYTVDTELQAAEIALAPAEVTNSTVTVNAVEGATVTINGNAYAAPVSVKPAQQSQLMLRQLKVTKLLMNLQSTVKR